MSRFKNGEVEIAYLDEGNGEPIVLVHGFASTKEVNWVLPGWVMTLMHEGRRVIALDNRGHGAYSKLYDPSAYHSAIMAEDVRALLDHLKLERADVMGYSMGARITAFLTTKHPSRVRSAIFGGLGIRLVEGVGLPESIAESLEAPSIADVRDLTGRMFRIFAEQTKSDLRALAACIRGSRQTLSRAEVAGVCVPVLVAVGTRDQVAGSAHELAALIPGARALDITDRDHMLAVGDKVYKAGVIDFLNQRGSERCRENLRMAQYQTRPVRGLDKVDPVWARIRSEAEDVARREPELATFIYENILHHDGLEAAIAHRVSQRLAHADVSADLIRQAYDDALEDQRTLGEAFRADIVATVDRDPATSRFIEPVLYYKGFHAIQTHRLAHWLYGKGRKDFALYLQSRASSVFQCDINPAAKIGRGIFLDHATGFVVGETAVIEDDVSILHDVTLGGTGKEHEDRHPKIRRGVMIGAGAKILGNIEVGHCARIAAGSVVIKPVPNNVTVAGVPAKVVGEAGCPEPSRAMDQMLYGIMLDG